MFSVVEEQDSTCYYLNQPLLFISKAHGMLCSHIRNFAIKRTMLKKYLPVCPAKQARSWSHASWLRNAETYVKNFSQSVIETPPRRISKAFCVTRIHNNHNYYVLNRYNQIKYLVTNSQFNVLRLHLFETCDDQCPQNGQIPCSKYYMIFNVCLTILWTLGVMSLTEDNKLFHTNHFYIKIEFNLK